jgi:hypothetical protein
VSEDQRRVCGSEVQIFTVSLNGANNLSTLIHSPLLAFFSGAQNRTTENHANLASHDCFNALSSESADESCPLPVPAQLFAS